MNTKEKEKRNTRSLSNRETLSRTVRRSFSFFGERGPMPLSPKTKHPNVSRKLRFLLIFPISCPSFPSHFGRKEDLPLSLSTSLLTTPLSRAPTLSLSLALPWGFGTDSSLSQHTYKHICYTFSTLAKLHKIGCLTRKWGKRKEEATLDICWKWPSPFKNLKNPVANIHRNSN